MSEMANEDDDPATCLTSHERCSMGAERDGLQQLPPWPSPPSWQESRDDPQGTGRTR